MAVSQSEVQLEPRPPAPGGEDAATRLRQLAGEVDAVLAAAQAWPADQQALLSELRAAIEALHREALLRLIRGLRADTAAAARLKELVRDPLLFGVLRLHGLVRDPLEARVREALTAVEPLLAQHGGGVELVEIKAPDTVHVRLTGACQGCPASGQTLSEGVRRAILEQVPEITHVLQVGGSAVSRTGGPTVSPFARASTEGFIDVCPLEELTPGQAQARWVAEREVLLYRQGSQVSCVDNACAHMGLRLSGGEVQDGIIHCPHHGFRYRLDTGECLTVPEVQLVVHAVQVRAGRVAVKFGG